MLAVQQAPRQAPNVLQVVVQHSEGALLQR